MGKQVNYIVCLDFETGGLSPNDNAVTQVGMEILHPVTFKSIATYASYITPYPQKEIGTKKKSVGIKNKRERTDKTNDLYIYTDKALEYTNITLDKLYKLGKPIDEVMNDMLDMFKKANPDNARNYKPIMLGQNLIFDVGFLQHMAAYCKIDLGKYLDGSKDFFGNFQPNYFDTLHLLKQYYAPDEKVTSHKLGLMADKLGIELVDAHDAMADVKATSGLFEVLMNNMRSSGGDGVTSSSVRTRDHFKF
tara:strand:- start:22704 stop:23450 length:747 start_codon:yes stop_codon:yes gene_type:complete